MLQRSRPTWLSRAAAADIVVLACAMSAGIHAGLVPEHLREEPRLGIAFVLAAVLLLAAATAVLRRPTDRTVARVAAGLLGALIAGYVTGRTTGIPFLAPDPEAFDAVGIAAVAVELLGVGFALWLGQLIGRPRRRPILQEVVR